MKIKTAFFIIIVLVFFLRIYKLDQIPPSISWDEAAVGYNAWSVANYGRDERGKFFPLYFASFGEGKNPVVIYITALFVKFMDLSEFSIRIPVVLMGLGNIFLIYFLTKNFFNNQTALLSAFFLSISPYSFHFSRFNHELNFALFFFMSGLLLFFYSLETKKWLLPVSLAIFILSFFSYNASKIFIPIIILVLFCVYIKKIINNRFYFAVSIIMLVSLSLFLFRNNELLGIERYKQTKTSNELIKKTEVYKNTKSLIFAKAYAILGNYFSYYSLDYLFTKGDTNSALSIQASGQFYPIDSIFLLIGIFIFIKNPSRNKSIFLIWLILGPLPSAIVSPDPHAGRGMFTLGAWQIITAVGVYSLIGLLKNMRFRVIGALTVMVVYLGFFTGLINYYFSTYGVKHAIGWQYGMKQVVEYVKENPQYSEIYVTDARSQPYIFFLFYLKYPLDEYLRTSLFNRSDISGSSLVSSFNKYYFGGYDSAHSLPTQDALYIVTPTEYTGLMYKHIFQVKKIVYYPDGGTAFYIVSLN